jgi:hypothetical protein
VVVHILQPIILAVVLIILRRIEKHPWLVIFPVIFAVYLLWRFHNVESKSRQHRVLTKTSEEPIPLRSTKIADQRRATALAVSSAEHTKNAAEETATRDEVAIDMGALTWANDFILGDESDDEDDEDSCKIDVSAAVDMFRSSDSDVMPTRKKKESSHFLFRLFSLHSFSSDHEEERNSHGHGAKREHDKEYNKLAKGRMSLNSFEDDNSINSSSEEEEGGVAHARRPVYRGMYSIASDDEQSDSDSDGDGDMANPKKTRKVSTFRQVRQTSEKPKARKRQKSNGVDMDGGWTGEPNRIGQMLELEAVHHRQESGGDVPPVEGTQQGSGLASRFRKLMSMSSDVSQYDAEVREPAAVSARRASASAQEDGSTAVSAR